MIRTPNHSVAIGLTCHVYRDQAGQVYLTSNDARLTDADGRPRQQGLLLVINPDRNPAAHRRLTRLLDREAEALDEAPRKFT